MDNPKALLDVKETAALVGKTVNALQYAIRKGTAPPSAIIMGRRVFRKDEVLDWIDQQFATQNQ